MSPHFRGIVVRLESRLTKTVVFGLTLLFRWQCLSVLGTHCHYDLIGMRSNARTIIVGENADQHRDPS